MTSKRKAVSPVQAGTLDHNSCQSAAAQHQRMIEYLKNPILTFLLQCLPNDRLAAIMLVIEGKL